MDDRSRCPECLDELGGQVRVLATVCGIRLVDAAHCDARRELVETRQPEPPERQQRRAAAGDVLLFGELVHRRLESAQVQGDALGHGALQ